jgi:undecaprenyl diphosphate synthase
MPSTENWRRPEDEVSVLMGLLKRYILADLEEFVANNVRLKIIGDYKAFWRAISSNCSKRHWPDRRERRDHAGGGAQLWLAR